MKRWLVFVVLGTACGGQGAPVQGAQGAAVAQAVQPAPAQGVQPAPAQAAPVVAEVTPVAAAQAPATQGSSSGEGCGQAAPGTCGEFAGKPIQHPDERTTTDPDTGATVTGAGLALAGAEVVRVKDLIEDPEAWAGKTVRLEGNVSAMCHHKRGWFGVVDDGDRSGAVVRVIAAPTFLVPAGSVGRKVVTEGVAELVDLPAAAARHYAKDYRVGDPSAIQGEAPVKQVIVRATGAEYR